MKIAVASKIRNEIDIIDPFLRHLDSLFDKVYLLDHKSKDGTTEILKEAVSQRPDWEYIYIDFNGHFHKQVSNTLMQKAFSEGADYLLTLDADEFLTFNDRQELEDALSRLDGFDGVGSFQWKNCIPCDFNKVMFTPETDVWCPSHRSHYTKVVVPRKLYKNPIKLFTSPGNHHVCDAQNRYVDKLDLEHWSMCRCGQEIRQKRKPSSNVSRIWRSKTEIVGMAFTTLRCYPRSPTILFQMRHSVGSLTFMNANGRS
jgi:hypothetical protein